MEPYLFSHNFLISDKLNELKKLICFDTIIHNNGKSHLDDNEIKTLVDQHINITEKIQFSDDNLFDWYDKNIIDQLNVLYPNLHFVLFKDDIEMIRCKENDFFKKHVDITNFYSNEFINYTCLINLQSCQEGGESVIYLDDESIEFKDINHSEGSLLLFQKQLHHEEKTILKGEKIIMVANILVFKKDHNYGDILIITIENTNYSYVIPIIHLNNFKQTLYYSYYNFQKKINPKESIFRYTESTINNNEFLIFYNLVYPVNSLNNLQILDYIGVDKSDVYKDFNTFINTGKVKNKYICKKNPLDYGIHYDDSCYDEDSWYSDEDNSVESSDDENFELDLGSDDFKGFKNYSKKERKQQYKITNKDIFMCHMDDYYHLVKLLDNEDIVPFQLITFENNDEDDDWYFNKKKNSIVVWFGVYDNLFVTCDYNLNKIPNTKHKYNNKLIELSDGQLNEIAKSLKINNTKLFDIYGESDNNTDKFKNIIFENNKFKKMNDITFCKSIDPYIAINKYITKIMKDIESIDICDNDLQKIKNSYITDQMQLDPLYKLYNYEKIYDSKLENYNTNDLDNLDLIGLLNRIKALNVVSNIKKSNTSIYLSEDSTQHTIYDIVFKFGFIFKNKIKPKKQNTN